LSLNFNISEISTILKEASIQEWELFLTCNTECALLPILNYRLPISSFDFSKKTVICDFEECISKNCYVIQDASLSEYQGLKNVFPQAYMN